MQNMVGGPSEHIRLSVVVPCYNESAGLLELCRRLSAVLLNVTRDYEIVFVNDGSRDNTWPLLYCLVSQDPHLVCVNLSRNHGHQLALSAGLATCRGERVLVIDADLQDPPELIPEMMRLMDEGADVVFGQRKQRAGETMFKRASAWAYYRLLHVLSDVEIPPDAGDFRLISRRVVDVFNAMPENDRFIRGMVSWIGFKQVPVPYERPPRFAGETHYSLGKMLRFAFDGITSFSVRPLRLALYAGLWLFALSMLLIAYAIRGFLVSSTVPGWTSVITVVLLFNSMQFLFLGLIGEYLGRLYAESKRRPLYVIQDVVYGAQLAQGTAPGLPGVSVVGER